MARWTAVAAKLLVPVEDWLHIPVPPIVDAALFAAVDEQLEENRRRARLGLRGAKYLLQGLVCCAQCGYAYYGKAISPSARKHHPRHYAYYRCVGTDAYGFGGVRVCGNHQVRTDLLAVWREASALSVPRQPRRCAGPRDGDHVECSGCRRIDRDARCCRCHSDRGCRPGTGRRGDHPDGRASRLASSS
jgi:hypothetical protein